MVVENMKLSLVLVSKTILQLVLFFLFLAFFGLPSFSQYQKKETIIVKSELDTQGIEAVLGKLGPGKLGPGQLGPGQLGPGAQLSGAQFAGAQLSGAQLSGAQFA